MFADLAEITRRSVRSSSGGVATTTITAPVQSGLLADYRMLPSESACALVDYSGNGNNATGCVGTSPSLAATTGGLVGNGAGAVALPAALNATLTVQMYIGNGGAASGSSGALLAGTGTYSTTNGTILLLSGTAQSADQVTSDGAPQRNTRILSGWMPGAGVSNEMPPTRGPLSAPRQILPGNKRRLWTRFIFM